MPSFRIDLPVEVSVDVEVDSAEVQKRVTRLLNNSWQGGSLHPAAQNFLVSTRLLLREAAAMALSATVWEHDFSSALSEVDRIIVNPSNKSDV